MKKRIILAISILVGCLILGIFFYKSQENKQQAIEKQHQIDLQEKAKENELRVKEEEKKQQAILNEQIKTKKEEEMRKEVRLQTP
jgi:CHASE3 domain sensor protein